ncbi:hypothetical protein ACFSLT_28315 [Novosphingobium resinovorum]
MDDLVERDVVHMEAPGTRRPQVLWREGDREIEVGERDRPARSVDPVETEANRVSAIRLARTRMKPAGSLISISTTLGWASAASRLSEPMEIRSPGDRASTAPV